MKRFFILLLSASIIYNYGEARLGCRDNSWHLQKKYDYKQDHAVECLCPCPETMGRCPKCQHYHEAKPWIIVKNNGKKARLSNLSQQNIQTIVKSLLTKYYQQKNSFEKNNYHFE